MPILCIDHGVWDVMCGALRLRRDSCILIKGVEGSWPWWGVPLHLLEVPPPRWGYGPHPPPVVSAPPPLVPPTRDPLFAAPFHVDSGTLITPSENTLSVYPSSSSRNKNAENIFSAFPVSARGVDARRSGAVDGELRAERGDDVEGGDGLKEKEKDVRA
ncbi:hypothetical protein Syun_022558 [Stephania yunnanensis]|uniref:Uncharacterized protein n=1 Tax=Stephania yunnanensis TaxID=152371 RepID=A0AAP0FEJ6_9MAGN